MNEKDIIHYFISKQQNDSVAEGIGDDCAVLNVTPGHQLVTSTDCMVEGRHFLTHTPAFYVGFKLMASSISDIASMCAQPKWATLNLTLTESNPIWLNEFADGLLSCARQNNVLLVGGDTTTGKQLNMSVQVTGEVPQDQAVLRAGAKAEDIIYVTGKIGCASRALQYLLQNNNQDSLLSDNQMHALYMPPSRVKLAIELRHCMHACIDISDGLLHELEILCEKSQLGAELHLEAIPIDDNIEIISAITSGDDYELLFTSDEKYKDDIRRIANNYDCLITPIGVMTNSNVIELTYHNEVVSYPERSGYDHFTHTE